MVSGLRQRTASTIIGDYGEDQLVKWFGMIKSEDEFDQDKDGTIQGKWDCEVKTMLFNFYHNCLSFRKEHAKKCFSNFLFLCCFDGSPYFRIFVRRPGLREDYFEYTTKGGVNMYGFKLDDLHYSAEIYDPSGIHNLREVSTANKDYLYRKYDFSKYEPKYRFNNSL